VIFDAIAHHLDDTWGPRALRGWCEGIGLRLSAPNALAAHAEDAAKVGPVALIPKLLSAKPPSATVAMAACREARCKTLFCQYLVGTADARGKLMVSRRIRSAAEADLPPSPTRASVPADDAGWQAVTARGKKAKTVQGAGPSAPVPKPRPSLSFSGLSPAATMRGMAIAPSADAGEGGTSDGEGRVDLT